MIKRIRAWFAWKLIKDISAPHQLYYENGVTGDRMVVSPDHNRGPWSPIDFDWLEQASGRGWYRDRFGDWVDAKL